MVEKGSRQVAGKKQPLREKTRFAGVYSRKIMNRSTNKPDTAFDITYKDAEGKKKWVLIGYASDGVNAAYANRRRGAILDGLSRGGEKPKTHKVAHAMTFGEAWRIFDEKWLPTLARPQDERNRYAFYLHDTLAHRRLDAITLLDLEGIKSAMLTKGYAPATVRMVLGDIRRVYRKISEWGLYDGTIPTDKLKMPRLDNARTRYLTQGEALMLLDALRVRSKAWHDIAALSLYTGMRKGEVLALRGEHLDFAAKRILVKDSKTGSRVVYMTDDVFALLQGVCPDNPTHFVFFVRGTNGAVPIKSDSDESYVRAVKECGLNEGITDRRHKVVFHTLRHTYCSWLAIAGVPLFTIGELVGHNSVEMTKRYSHLCPDAKQEAAALIGSILQKARE